MYPTTPTTTIGGVSRIVTASTISFLLISEEKKDQYNGHKDMKIFEVMYKGMCTAWPFPQITAQWATGRIWNMPDLRLLRASRAAIMISDIVRFRPHCLRLRYTFNRFGVPGFPGSPTAGLSGLKSSKQSVGLTGSRSVGFPDHMGHTSLVSDEGGQVNGLGRVVFGEGLHLTTMTTGPLFGVEPHRSMTGRREFPVRLK